VGCPLGGKLLTEVFVLLLEYVHKLARCIGRHIGGGPHHIAVYQDVDGALHLLAL